MENLHLLELDLLIWMQSMGDWLYYPMRAFSFLGDENFFIFGLALLYWGIHSRLGLRIAIVLVLSISINTFFKVFFAYPRPFWVDSRIKALTTETSFGFPSGHAQNSTAIWGLGSRTVQRKPFTILVIILVAFIGISRLYLGVHFFSDVIGGWLLGLALLLAFIRLEPALSRWIMTRNRSQKLLLVLGSGLFLLALMSIPYAFQLQWQIPQTWLDTSQKSAAGYSPDPLSMETPFTLVGVWLGMLGGAAWFTHQFGEFKANGAIQTRLLRCLIGVIGLLVLRFGLGAIFPHNEDIVGLLFRLLRYALLGFWVSAAGPWVFGWLKITSPSTR